MFIYTLTFFMERPLQEPAVPAKKVTGPVSKYPALVL
jgi:hypothetical protein